MIALTAQLWFLVLGQMMLSLEHTEHGTFANKDSHR